jgi:hypothetical protein
MFRKLDQFPSSGVRLVTLTRLGLLESLVQRKVYVPPVSHLKTETYPVFETLCFLEYQSVYKVQKPSPPKVYLYVSQ